MVLQARRIAVAAMMEGALITLGLVYATAGKDLFEYAEQHPGPFSGIISSMDTVMPLVIGLLMVAVIGWMLAAPVQQERTQIRRRIR